MKSRSLKMLALSVPALAVTLGQPAAATVVTYGTGIHHWVLSCGPYPPDGHGTSQYVGSSVCPNNNPDPVNCKCQWTPYDFPVNNPYPDFRVVTGFDANDPGHVHVIVDAAQGGVIECGVSVIPEDDNTGVCGAPFTTMPISRSSVDPIVLKAVDALIPDLEKINGVVVTSVTYSVATSVADSVADPVAASQR